MAGFDPNAYISQKSSFSPDDYIASKTAPPPSTADKAQASLEGFGQAATAGYLPHLQALTEPAETYLLNKITGQNVEPDNYIQAKDQNIARLQSEEEKTPGYFYGGELAGAIASAPLYGKALGLIPGLAPAEGAGLIKNTAQAAGGGAVMGAIQNPGDTKGELSTLQVPERMTNAYTGAVVGGVTGAVASGIKSASDFIFNTPERLQDWSQLKAAKSAGMMLKDYRQMNARSPSFDPEQRIKQVGQAMIDNGLVRPGSTFEDVADKSLQLKQQAGKIIGDVYESASNALGALKPGDLTPEKQALIEKTSLNAKDWAKELSEKFGGITDEEGAIVKPGDLTGKAGGTSALGAVKTTLDELAQNGNEVNLAKIQQFKSDLDGLINYNKRFDDTPLKNEYLYKVRDFINQKIQARIDALDQVLGSDKLQTLKEANKDYGIWSEVNRISQDRVNRESANRFASLTDTIAGVGGAGSGAMVGALMGGDENKTGSILKGAALGSLAGVANHAARLYGNPYAVNAANFTGNTLNKIPRVIPNTMGLIGGAGVVNPAVTGSIASRIANPPKNKKGLLP